MVNSLFFIFFQFSGCTQSIEIFDAGSVTGTSTSYGVFCDGNVPALYSAGGPLILDFSAITDSSERWEFEFTASDPTGTIRTYYVARPDRPGASCSSSSFIIVRISFGSQLLPLGFDLQ